MTIESGARLCAPTVSGLMVNVLNKVCHATTVTKLYQWRSHGDSSD
ncbi:hypothetical protein [Coleofasciculus sp. E1-EBD-02]